MTSKRFFVHAVFIFSSALSYAQGLGIPSKKMGIGFGNLPVFTGLRINYRDKNVEKINGINVTIWQYKNSEDETGTLNGVSLGLPMATGIANRNGIGVGVFGIAAGKNLNGIHIGGLGIGAGGDVKGINVGGLGIGSGGDLIGINIGGLGAGSGGDVVGLNIGGLGIGSGGDLKGISIGGLGVGSGGKVSGICIGLVGVGAGEDLTGLSIGGVGVGSGGRVRGITIGGIGVGAGEEVDGIAISGVAVGSVKIKALAIAPVVGSQNMNGLIVAPAYMKVGYTRKDEVDGEIAKSDMEGIFRGVSVSAFNHIKGDQHGVTIGIVNFTKKINGFQLGLINIVKENPKGLRVLPIFNTRFGKRKAS